MFQRTLFLSGIVVALLSVASRADAGPVVMNPGFETGDFTGWLVGGTASSGVGSDGASIPSTGVVGNYVHARTGAHAAYASLEMVNLVPTTFSLSQTFDVEPKTSYQWGYSLGVYGTQPVYASWTRKTYVNGVLWGGWGSGSNLSNFYATAGEGNWVAGAGQTSAAFTFEITGSARTPGSIGFSFDDFYFRAVPEPGSLVAIALLPLLMRRRRS